MAFEAAPTAGAKDPKRAKGGGGNVSLHLSLPPALKRRLLAVAEAREQRESIVVQNALLATLPELEALAGITPEHLLNDETSALSAPPAGGPMELAAKAAARLNKLNQTLTSSVADTHWNPTS